MRTLTLFLTFSVVFSLFLTGGCSHSDKSKKYDALKYLTADKNQRIPAQEFEEALSREVYLAGGNYHIVAFPYTNAYLSSLVNERAKAKGFSDKDKKETLKRLKERFISKKTCFKFRYRKPGSTVSTG